MNRLSDSVKLNGPGIPWLMATLLMRDGNTCLYERSDGVFEVFLVSISPETEAFGKSYPPREVYPGNDDFGKTAWCFSNRDLAVKKYLSLVRVHTNYQRSIEKYMLVPERDQS